MKATTRQLSYIGRMDDKSVKCFAPKNIAPKDGEQRNSEKAPISFFKI